MRLNEDSYRKKVRAGWLGKCIGGNLGAIPECLKKRSYFLKPEDFMPEKMLANDDLDLQLVWLQVLLDKGLSFTSDDLMEEFIKCYPANPNEYGYGKRNYRRGIKPPVSGTFANEFFMNSMGCPIRAEIWAMICPGRPEKGIELAYRDGCLDHGEESIYAEQYITALESLSFMSQDRPMLIKKAMEYIPETSRIYHVISDVSGAFEKGAELEKVMDYLETEYGDVDCSISFYNIGVIVLALLYGNGEFEKTITLAVNCGYDTDCTAATLGAVLGIMYGEEIFGEKWLGYCGEEIITGCVNLHYDILTIDKLSRITCNFGIETDLQECGKEQADSFTMDYVGLPEIGPAKTAEIQVKLPLSPAGEENELVWDVPDGLKMDKGRTEKTEKGTEYFYMIHMEETVRCLSDHYVIKASLKDTDGKTSRIQSIGLAGVQPFRILGPFWDMFDWKKVSEEERINQKMYFPFPEHKIFRYLSLAEAHNNFAFLNREYISEDFDSGAFSNYFDAGKKYYAGEDSLRIDEMFGYKGPCCVYALQKLCLKTDEEVQFHIGSTTPFKLWVNGKEAYAIEDCKGYSPYNDLVNSRLKKGENQIVLKLLRFSEGQKLTFVIREAPFEHTGQIKTDQCWLL